MKAIMYHYVRRYQDRFPHFRYLSVDNFRRQLDFFGEKYGFVTRENWDAFIEEPSTSANVNGVVLTFDDALSCHYEFVARELSSRGLWGIFYVPTMPYISGQMLDVHKIHQLCGVFPGESLFQLASNKIDEGMFYHDRKAEFEKMSYDNQRNAYGITEFKRILNYFLRDEFKSEVINSVASSLNYEFSGLDYYVSEKELLEMASSGNIIGSHTVTHRLMSTLNYERQVTEIRDSFDYLDSFLRQEHRTYCHPYGGFHSFNDATLSILETSGVDYAFNVEPRDIDRADFKSRFALPRYDCNEFQFGQVS